MKDKLLISAFVLLCAFSFTSATATARVEIWDSAKSPTFIENLTLSSVTVGTGGNYATLKAAFDAIIGQGFFVKTTAHGNLVFNNSMRTGNTANQFFRSNNSTVIDTTNIERHRIWLTIANDNATLNTILVGYVTGATAGVDFGYDGLSFGSTGSEFYSIIEGNPYIIQGRALPFTDDDIVPLGFNATEAGNFTIAIYDTDGLFAGDQDIMIKDNVTGTTTSIKITPYTFSSAIGVFNERFEIVYVDVNLAVDPDTILKDSTIIYSKEGMLFVQSGTAINTIRIFDVQGRLLSENKNINDTAFQIDQSRLANQVLLVQVTNNNDKKVVKKIIL